MRSTSSNSNKACAGIDCRTHKEPTGYWRRWCMIREYIVTRQNMGGVAMVIQPEKGMMSQFISNPYSTVMTMQVRSNESWTDCVGTSD